MWENFKRKFAAAENDFCQWWHACVRTRQAQTIFFLFFFSSVRRRTSTQIKPSKCKWHAALSLHWFSGNWFPSLPLSSSLTHSLMHAIFPPDCIYFARSAMYNSLTLCYFCYIFFTCTAQHTLKWTKTCVQLRTLIACMKNKQSTYSPLVQLFTSFFLLFRVFFLACDFAHLFYFMRYVRGSVRMMRQFFN